MNETVFRAYQESWRRFDCGDNLADGEVRLLYQQSQQVYDYLRARGATKLIGMKIILDMEQLRSFMLARGMIDPQSTGE